MGSKPVMSNTSGSAVHDAVADIVNKTAAPFQNLANPDAKVLDKARGVVGAVAGLMNAPSDFLNDAFARATNPIAKAWPSFPAATMGMVVLGIPHTHTHPPAMPVPLPAIGAIMTGCPSVLIGGVPAARSGDFGLGPTCGSLGPTFEVLTGSSKVFIGGQRAARMLDITLQCIKGPPKATAAGALSKIDKAINVATKITEKAGQASMVLGIVGAAEKIVDTQVAAKSAQAAEGAAMNAPDAAAVAEAQGDAAAAAAEAAGAVLAAAMMGADMAMNAAASALKALQGKDPGAPPCFGAVMLGMPTVLIGGFPMPTWSNVAKGLKKLVSALARGRRGGVARGVSFCLDCI